MTTFSAEDEGRERSFDADLSALGMDPARARDLIAAIAPHAQKPSLSDVFARACWSGLAEPGDRVAAALIALLGPMRALLAVNARSAPSELSAVLRRECVLGGPVSDAVDPPGVHELATALDRWQLRVDPSAFIRVLRASVNHGFRLLTPGDALWPSGLADLGMHAPLALWISGELSPEPETMVAVVGARAVSTYGSRMAGDLAAGLTDYGCAILSGGAMGVDGVAHRTCLASGGATVAVLAGGLDRLYPRAHSSLFEEIRQRGSLISEVPCGAAPTRWRFLHKNS